MQLELQTLRQYAKMKAENGEVARFKFEEGSFGTGTIWIHDEDYKLLDHKIFLSMADAKKACERAINWADKFWIDN